MEFVHLHVHSDYSLLDGASKLDKLCEQTKKLKMNAIALTDHGNLFGAINFYITAKKYELNPLIGCEIYLNCNNDSNFSPIYLNKNNIQLKRPKYYHMGLIAKDYNGYKNLIKLVSIANTTGFYYKPTLTLNQIKQYSEGLIGFSGCMQGLIPQLLINKHYDKAKLALQYFSNIFNKDNFVIEIQNHGIEKQKLIIEPLLDLSKKFNIKIVATNDVHYVCKEHSSAHDSMLCIQTGSKINDINRMKYNGKEFYLKSPDEMFSIFSHIPESIYNTIILANECKINIPFNKNHYPVFKLNHKIKKSLNINNNFEFIKYLCLKGLKSRFNLNKNNNEYQNIIKRLNYELSIIHKTNFVDYFLIVWDFVSWAKSKKITTGPGRGSGAGCIVAYLLSITDIDPIKFGLIFERFLNPERISPPDFDIDFCMRRRNEVITYVRKKYGENCVANIVTFGTFGAKMVIRDLARINNIEYTTANKISKMIPSDIGISIANALKKSSELNIEIQKNKTIKNIFKQGEILEGMVRNIGTHAAGIVISDYPIENIIPVIIQENCLTTQYSKNIIEKLGLLKMDFLGLKTLTIISDTEENINRKQKNIFSIENISFNDKKTFDLLNNGNTTGVFQLESSGMKSLCQQLNINTLNEIIALIALYRPGPMEWIPKYIAGKQNPKSIEYIHPLLKNICSETYGVMIYQEQVIEAAKIIAGYSAGSADILRKAMAKKNNHEMIKQQNIFIEGALKTNNIKKQKASEIFDILAKFAGYGFNKSHSTCYAVIAYRTAYLKAHYPIEFMSSVLSSELGNIDKLSHLIQECSKMQINILGPNINESRSNFTPIYNKSKSIRFGLSAIKRVGDIAALHIIKERDNNGVFKSFFDFIKRCNKQIINKKIIENLILSGCFDNFDKNRNNFLINLEKYLNFFALQNKEKIQGQTLMFDCFSENLSYNFINTKICKPSISFFDKLKNEKDLLGVYLSGHPLDLYNKFIEYINRIKNNIFTLCGIIFNVTKNLSKKNNLIWAECTVSTKHNIIKISILPQLFNKLEDSLFENNIVVIKGTILKKNNTKSYIAYNIYPLDKYLTNLINCINWIIYDIYSPLLFINQLKKYIHLNMTNGLITHHIYINTMNNNFLNIKLHKSSFNIEGIYKLNKLKYVKNVNFNIKKNI